MIYLDVVFDNEHKTSISIRRLTAYYRGLPIYAYEVSGEARKPYRGTVTHQGPEGLGLVAAVLDDYVHHRASVPRSR